MVRLAREKEEGLFTRNLLVKNFWKDVDTRSLKLGTEGLWNRKQGLKLLAEQFRASLLNYDEGILSNDMTLASAVWRQFFAQQCEDAEQLELVVHYVRAQVDNLERYAGYDLMTKGLIKWAPLGID